jgi:hypothetical protein
MTARYGFRSGWSKFKLLSKAFCRLYQVFSKTIDAWAEANMTPANFTTFKQFTALIGPVCVIVDSIPDD